jgi:uncharacterized protein (TIGR02271 family)
MEDKVTMGNLRRLSDADFEVAKDEPDVRGWHVITSDGDEVGDVDDLIVDPSAMKVRYIAIERDDDSATTNERDLFIPIQQVDLDSDHKRVVVRGTTSAIRNMVPAEFANQFSDRQRSTRSTPSASANAGTDEVQRMTRAEEEVRVSTRPKAAGEVRVGKHVETHHVREDVLVSREQVHVERRPVRESGASAEIRGSAEEIRVPIIEEEIVVEKRPVVKEELIVSKERVEERRPVDVEARREEFDIDEPRRSTNEPPRGGER